MLSVLLKRKQKIESI